MDERYKTFAFPSTVPPACQNGQDIPYGLTKRELFAAMAMQGLCLNTNAYYESGAHNEAIAQRAVAVADALIVALAK